MKTAVCHYRYAPPYPNAADRKTLLNKFLDYLLIAAMGVAAVTAVLFLLSLA